jgi:hypothetical protein
MFLCLSNSIRHAKMYLELMAILTVLVYNLSSNCGLNLHSSTVGNLLSQHKPYPTPHW